MDYRHNHPALSGVPKCKNTSFISYLGLKPKAWAFVVSSLDCRAPITIYPNASVMKGSAANAIGLGAQKGMSVYVLAIGCDLKES
jgi:hypothetical protein